MNNIIFYFSGTGNSLKAAKAIAAELGNCRIVSMGKPGNYTLTEKYDSIGFIYPVYFWGLPKKTIEFIKNMNLDTSKNAYFYSLATMGGDAMYAVYQIYEIMEKRHGIKMNYCQKIKMFSNDVLLYEMRKDVAGITKKSNEKLVPIIKAIKNRENNKANKFTKIFAFLNKQFLKTVSNTDRHYTVDNNCTGCGICEKVCPVKNITMKNNKPEYSHNCEQCVACIQYCPPMAINYKNVTQNRRRYNHPEIDYKELAKYNNGLV